MSKRDLENVTFSQLTLFFQSFEQDITSFKVFYNNVTVQNVHRILQIF